MLNHFNKVFFCFPLTEIFESLNGKIPIVKSKKIFKNLFYCNENSIFINKAYVCDGKNDCKLGSDEKNCSKFNLNTFKCDYHKKNINIFKVCNHVPDCEDEQDELECR